MKHQSNQVLSYNAIFEPCEEGGFTVTVPKLPGLTTEGDTYEEAQANTKDAINGYLEVLSESGEDLPEPDYQTFTSPIAVNFIPPRLAIS
jgi:predicted RNase H-like HicB family nuclease